MFENLQIHFYRIEARFMELEKLIVREIYKSSFRELKNIITREIYKSRFSELEN